jgi:integral membrane sensor domain MASE1
LFTKAPENTHFFGRHIPLERISCRNAATRTDNIDMPEPNRNLPKLLFPLVGVVVAYDLSGLLGVVMDKAGDQVYLIWPPAGVAMFALLAWGPRLWPAIFVASLLLSLGAGTPALPSFLIAIGNTLGPLAAQQILTRMAFDRRFYRLMDYLIFGGVGCTVVSVIAACLGTGALVVTGETALQVAGRTWSIWCLGDFLGALLIGPTLFSLFPDAGRARS